MNAHDETRLRDMLDEARLAVRFMVGKTLEDLDQDQLLQHGVVRALEIIGEAAARITQETQTQCPQIPWKNIIGMRNRVVHDYTGVDI